MDKFTENMEAASARAQELAKKLGVEYTPPAPPLEEDIQKKTDVYISVMNNRHEINKILNSITDEEKVAYQNLQNSKK